MGAKGPPVSAAFAFLEMCYGAQDPRIKYLYCTSSPPSTNTMAKPSQSKTTSQAQNKGSLTHKQRLFIPKSSTLSAWVLKAKSFQLQAHYHLLFFICTKLLLLQINIGKRGRQTDEFTTCTADSSQMTRFPIKETAELSSKEIFTGPAKDGLLYSELGPQSIS